MFLRAVLLGAVSAALAAASCNAPAAYVQHNLVSDIPGLADHTDDHLRNPWGLTSGPTTPFWVSDNGAGVQTLYNGAGTPQSLVVTLPNGAPTGTQFNPTNDFVLPTGGASRFIFSSFGGTITAWNPAQGTTALVEAQHAGAYTGLAVLNDGTASRLYAANFGAGAIDVYDGNFALTSVPGGFTDPNLPSGFVPFNVDAIGGNLVVTYAQPAPDSAVFGPGLGIVDLFNPAGTLLQRLITGGPLNAPWGITLAPGTFGPFANALLVGNVGDGRINAFDPASGAFLGALTDANGNPIVNDHLWGLRFGNGGNGGDPNVLFFTAGINNRVDGLFGSIAPVPEPSTFALLLAGGAVVAATRRRRT